MASVEARPAKLEAKAVEIPEEELLIEDSDSMGAILREWIRTQAPWWAVSFTVHMVLLASLLLLGSLASSKIADDIPTFDEVQTPPTSPSSR